MADNRIDIVITMGGLGSRFKKAGYTVPKYMIDAKGKSLFEWSMISLEGYRDQADRYIFLALKDEGCDVEAYIREKCALLGIENYHVIILDELTDGQATTAMLAEKYWDEDHALLIYNIDTYVEAGEMNTSQLRGDGFIPCFQAPGDHWSFVRLDESGKVVEIKEKKRISDHCTLGAYYFKTCGLYASLYDEYYRKGKASELVNGEKYVAPLYDYLLSKKGEIYIVDVPADKVHVLGTPEELQAFLNEED
ncbi:MAG: glycosyltransferase family 2 protein [Lachnospiraceae bacterium]|nr:glycosyltransferase family 2 protein [Lachnospiraceae bacterium]